MCSFFSCKGYVANVNDIMDSKTSFKLICQLKASNGPNDLSVKPRHIYWPTKEDLMVSLQNVKKKNLGFTPSQDWRAKTWVLHHIFIEFNLSCNKRVIRMYT